VCSFVRGSDWNGCVQEDVVDEVARGSCIFALARCVDTRDHAAVGG
jgi:hypothetical protein